MHSKASGMGGNDPVQLARQKTKRAAIAGRP
jgi:hypothetical protein